MHYQIALVDIHLFYQDDLEQRPSELVASESTPAHTPGKGLFTKVARKKGEFIVGFPGYWMESAVFGPAANNNGDYAFKLPKNGGWEGVHHLVYATHSCQANFINAAVVNDEVLIHIRTHAHMPVLSSRRTGHCDLCMQVLGKLNVDMVFGDFAPPKTSKNIKDGPRHECLIKVYASMAIAAGSELLSTYGPDYWE